MEKSNLFFSYFFFTLLLIITAYVNATHGQNVHHGYKTQKLFVFGDSYADTGNVMKSLASSWKEPYGTTFPGKPAGRFSDGRVLTDYFARFMGLKSPVAYRWMKYAGKKIRNGMNFAYGGSGVFNTLGDLLPNMTTQIGFFEKLMNDSVYTKQDLQSSVVLFCLAGNDYGFYTATGGSDQGLPKFIPTVINQLTQNINRIRELGATKIAVTSLEPLGCLPRMTQTSSFQKCNATQNLLVNYHNLLLQQSIAGLNNQTGKSPIFLVDLYSSFTTVLNQKGTHQGLKFGTPLKPCCMGVSDEYYCGSADEKGAKMYTVCSDPKSSFFWDSSHPTEAGWQAVYMNLKSSLEQFIKV